MLDENLTDQLRAIAYCEMAKPAARVSALASLARNAIDIDAVRNTLYKLSTEPNTPDLIKVRAIDLLDKFDIPEKRKELAPNEIQSAAETLMRQYVTNT